MFAQLDLVSYSFHAYVFAPTYSPQEHEFEIGSVIAAKVVELRDTGLMMELAPRVYTLLHVSKISSGFVSCLFENETELIGRAGAWEHYMIVMHVLSMVCVFAIMDLHISSSSTRTGLKTFIGLVTVFL